MSLTYFFLIKNQWRNYGGGWHVAPIQTMPPPPPIWLLIVHNKCNGETNHCDGVLLTPSPDEGICPPPPNKKKIIIIKTQLRQWSKPIFCNPIIRPSFHIHTHIYITQGVFVVRLLTLFLRRWLWGNIFYLPLLNKLINIPSGPLQLLASNDAHSVLLPLSRTQLQVSLHQIKSHWRP